MKRNLTLMAGAALAVGLIAAGCGSDGNDDASSSTGTEASAALTKAEFVTQADAICQQGNDELDAATASFDKNTSQAEFEAFATDTLAPNVQSQVDQIDALVPPAADQEQVDAILSAAQDGVDQIKADPGALENGDPLAKANKLAADYGLKVCGQG